MNLCPTSHLHLQFRSFVQFYRFLFQSWHLSFTRSLRFGVFPLFETGSTKDINTKAHQTIEHTHNMLPAYQQQHQQQMSVDQEKNWSNKNRRGKGREGKVERKISFWYWQVCWMEMVNPQTSDREAIQMVKLNCERHWWIAHTIS